jgi:hypothetical protein
MSFNFLVPGNFSITQNAELYVMSQNTLSTSKYHWRIDCGSTLNTLFNTRTYTENTANNSFYNTTLITNYTEIESLLTNTGLSYDTTGNAGSTATMLGLVEPTANFNLRLLEMAALEIFGHAKARAAFSNDGSFINHHTTVSNHLFNSFNTESIRNTFFEQYVQLNRINQADVDVSATFNLAETSLFVYGNLNGNIIDATSSTAVTGSIFKTSYSTTMRIEFKGRT